VVSLTDAIQDGFRKRHFVIVLALIAAWALVAVASARADTTVTVGGSCSLEQAVDYADGSSELGCAPGSASGTTTIDLPASTTDYTVSSTLSITADTIIDGAGAANTIIDGGGAVQVLNIAAGADVTLSDVTVSRGLSGDASTGCGGSPPFRTCPAENGLNGGGIANAGTLTLLDSAVSGNSASAGTLPHSILIFCDPDCFARPGESAGNGGDGGGIYNTGELTVEDSTISDNAAGDGGNGSAGASGTGSHTSPGQEGGSGGYGGEGGGIYSESGATVTIISSTIAGNVSGNGGSAGGGSTASSSPAAGGNAGSAFFGGAGGGIFSLGALTVTGSTISANASGVGGGGASGGGGTGGEPSGSSSASAVGGYGGGVYIFSSQTATFTNDTIAGNSASAGGTGGTGPGSGGPGGAIVQAGFDPIQLTFVTIADNSAAGSDGAIDGANGSLGGSITEEDSIIANNTGSPVGNCTPDTVTDAGNNVVFGESTCPGTKGNPKLEPLAENGGPTETMALEPGSAAIGLVPVDDCPVSSDQRGVARPQGSDCDAGAYELATPALTGVGASATGTSTATVTASVKANLKETEVVVDYGPSTAYGSSTAPQDVGAGNVAVSFSAGLSGLAPSTTYHYAVVASNGDGTTTSADGTFTTPTAPSTGSTPSTSTSPPPVVVCSPPVGRTCGGASYPTIHASIAFTWAFGRRYTAERKLVVSHIPRGGHVEVLCHGGGCPFARRTFSAHKGTVTLTRLFKSSHLRPGATLQIEVLAAGQIGEVEIFKIHSDSEPSLRKSCLQPGASHPTRCV